MSPMPADILQFPADVQICQRLCALGAKLDEFYQRDAMLRNHLEENKAAWDAAKKEYNALQRELPTIIGVKSQRNPGNNARASN